VCDAIEEAVKRGKPFWYYIAGILINRKRCEDQQKKRRGTRNDDPDKYIKGKYSHMVKR